MTQLNLSWSERAETLTLSRTVHGNVEGGTNQARMTVGPGAVRSEHGPHIVSMVLTGSETSATS